MLGVIKKILLWIIPLLFLIVGVATIHDYGINWDEPFHFHRGQAYLHYLMTGKKDFKDLPAYENLIAKCLTGESICDGGPKGPGDLGYVSSDKSSYENLVMQKAKNQNLRRSLFQAGIYDYSYFIKTDSGHPPTSDILSAFSNYIFYQRLGILSDVDAHHLYEVVMTFLLIAGVGIFAYLNFGLLASLVSSISLALYPLLFAESHFNIKDPPETAFFGLSIITFYFATLKKKWYLLLLSAVSAGLALGTKFNALFLPVIIFPWLIAYFLFKKQKWQEIKSLKYWFILYPIIVISIFYIFWPFLWSAPIKNLLQVINYYRVIGAGVQSEQLRFIFMGINTYPLTWIVVTTPLSILFLSAVGLFGSLYNLIKKRESVYLLILLWFAFPIIRVSVGNTAIYGGVRQIMEYVPGMALLSGLGAKYLFDFVRKNIFLRSLILIAIFSSLSFTLWEMVRIHPNENLYFNQIIGGMAGAKAAQIPYWGNSYGNIYKQGIDWLNKNAETNARLTTLVGTMANINWSELRSDIFYHNKYWSGPNKAGEYAIEANYGDPYGSYYRYAYYDKFLVPVYEIKMNGVALLKIWKNDSEHTKPEYKREVEIQPKEVRLNAEKIYIDIGEEVSLTKIFVKHSQYYCKPQVGGYLSTSLDGNSWVRQADSIDLAQTTSEASGEILGFTKENFAFYFPATKARFITIDTGDKDSCYLKNSEVSVYSLPSK